MCQRVSFNEKFEMWNLKLGCSALAARKNIK